MYSGYERSSAVQLLKQVERDYSLEQTVLCQNSRLIVTTIKFRKTLRQTNLSYVLARVADVGIKWKTIKSTLERER